MKKIMPVHKLFYGYAVCGSGSLKLTADKDKVTCKKCLKIMGKLK
jgi:hypothetical protein